MTINEPQRLTLIGPIEIRKSSGGSLMRYATYQCSCGNVVQRRTDHVKRGATKSCGCLYEEVMGRPRTTHGASGTPLHRAWHAMRLRCSPTVQRIYPSYDGVTCDPRWTTFEGFVANQPPGRPFSPGLALSRIGDVGNYSPENCRWVTRSENSREVNERRMLRLDDGRFAADVARENGISQKTWRTRYYRGWSIEDAVTVRPHGRPRPSP